MCIRDRCLPLPAETIRPLRTAASGVRRPTSQWNLPQPAPQHLAQPSAAASQNYDLRPRRAGDARGGREGCPSPLPSPARGLRKRCKLPAGMGTRRQWPRPRRDVDTSRDRLETETSRPRPQPWLWAPLSGAQIRWLGLWHLCRTRHAS